MVFEARSPLAPFERVIAVTHRTRPGLETTNQK